MLDTLWLVQTRCFDKLWCLRKWIAAAEISNPSHHIEWGSSIFTFLTLRVSPWLTRKKGEKKKKKNDSIKLTSPPFHVWKEVITVLYTADEARPIMMEGWTEWFLCADQDTLKWRFESWGGCIKKIRINSTRLCSSCYTKSSAVFSVIPVYVCLVRHEKGWFCTKFYIKLEW